MRLNEVAYGTGQPIESYSSTGFRIGGIWHEGSVLVAPQTVSAWGGFADLGPLVDLAGDIDVVLVGTGTDIAPLPDGFRQGLEAAGIGVEMMASGAACRTYNVLLGEGRRIAAALIAG